jgi:hypothetical protein
MLAFTDSDYQETDFSRLLINTPGAFLVCGGPSANNMDLKSLNNRGIFSLAVNNVAGHSEFKPSAFVCSDPPEKFHLGIWKDPSIMKFVPHPKLRKGRSVLVERRGAGDFRKIKLSARDCPNTWSFLRRAWFTPDDSFFTEGASWGNLDAGVKRTGLPKTACTMLLGIRLLYEFGVRKIYLLGVDFDMTPGYSFPQHRDDGSIKSNNNQFRIVNEWLTKMETDGVFDRAGLQIFNCNLSSKLEAFTKIGFGSAMADILCDFPAEPFDLEGWYEKQAVQ